jgi:CRP-like cAMP-binding protein
MAVRTATRRAKSDDARPGRAAPGPLDETLKAAFACSDEIAAAVGRRAAEKTWPARAVILRQGDRPDETYLMASGRAHALLYGRQGQVVLLHEFEPGDLFGAVTELTPAPHASEVAAVDDVRAAAFPAAAFLELVETYSCVGLAVSRALLRQLRAAAVRMVERTTLSAAGRVHAELLRLARAGDGATIRPAPVLAAFALRVHSTRETVSRTINALERRGFIRREEDALVIVAPQRLEEMMI